MASTLLKPQSGNDNENVEVVNKKSLVNSLNLGSERELLNKFDHGLRDREDFSYENNG